MSTRKTALDKPPPGSDAALEMGCCCPILDNEFGRGMMGNPRYFVVSEGCPVHTFDDAVQGAHPRRWHWPHFRLPRIRITIS